MTDSKSEIVQLRARIEFLERLVRAREKKITELGSMLRGQEPSGPSALKRRLEKLWDNLPRSVQRRIEPLADIIDRAVK